MTIHAAKGLEFPVVFTVGLEEGLFPSGMSINSREESRKKNAVCSMWRVTRAENAFVPHVCEQPLPFRTACSRMSLSRFLDEMPEQHIDRSYAGGGLRNSGNIGGGASWGNMFDRKESAGATAASR